jgi:hypothetical protein
MSLYQALIWPFDGSMSIGVATMVAVGLAVGTLIAIVLSRYVLPKDPYQPT